MGERPSTLIFFKWSSSSEDSAGGSTTSVAIREFSWAACAASASSGVMLARLWTAAMLCQDSRVKRDEIVLGRKTS